MGAKIYRKRCVWCDADVLMTKHQRYCSQKCGRNGQSIVMSDEALSARARKAAMASVLVRRKRRHERWGALIAECGPELACIRAYERGYYAGRRARKKENTA